MGQDTLVKDSEDAGTFKLWMREIVDTLRNVSDTRLELEARCRTCMDHCFFTINN